MPSSNTSFWAGKLEDNQRRDVLAHLALISAGWRTATIWECALKTVKTRKRWPNIAQSLDDWIRLEPESMNFETGVDLVPPLIS